MKSCTGKHWVDQRALCSTSCRRASVDSCPSCRPPPGAPLTLFGVVVHHQHVGVVAPGLANQVGARHGTM